MRQSHLFAPTLREAPAEAEALGHRMLLRGGYIRPLAAGVYSYLPLGQRVLRNIEKIIREEMELAGAAELMLPSMQPAELWHQSGRYDEYGPELIRFHDRNGREFALGPTHEEIVTALVGQEISSYRQLPLRLYQIQNKFRDERRPRYGLLRCREFAMKDAYSFDTDEAGLDAAYTAMRAAYARIFQQCGLIFREVEADAGAIGGSGGSHEFVALAEIGEDTIAVCSHCEYAANVEKAETAPLQQSEHGADAGVPERLYTPGIRTIEQLAVAGYKPEHIIKTLIYVADGTPVAVLVRGDHEVNEIKLMRHLGAQELVLADAETVLAAAGAPAGFAGPLKLSVPAYVDREAAALRSAITGAGEQDWHLKNVRPGRDFTLERIGDFRIAREGDPCPRCHHPLESYRGIEVGHVFKLGDKYSAPLNAVYSGTDGRMQRMQMGCYGIGVSRLLAAVAEQCAGEKGIVWPMGIAPFHVHLIRVSAKDEAQRTAADTLYSRLQGEGLEVLFDDRDERAGVKFHDADMLGIPLCLIIGKGASEGLAELKHQSSGRQWELKLDDAADFIKEIVQSEMRLKENNK
ncbi:proline--tRNA ligase [Paenibacillus thalictri]|uniref:Proline--tRNA ligase n=1 Tax=Paenibacillus thalictri TaxID=2527873 RepID=A0A4Q9DHY6_9BACL|nr:proline--tRNA ligase [Paenibacillus thalictri]TBL72668.1 proline--tRNA ligase [Paenibacillus thalictri]